MLKAEDDENQEDGPGGGIESVQASSAISSFSISRTFFSRTQGKYIHGRGEFGLVSRPHSNLNGSRGSTHLTIKPTGFCKRKHGRCHLVMNLGI
jgi:hypothetical protein